ncbi:uncharacterized protein LOC110106073 [Dendrobium catenatum]|uniref:Uncharacterized protein n=1 Tax=Dendrobium catenatum TaxID=906689 RepID=A0A2I0VQJ8_9ASPA|nr:uncharacterized protein LOC110106073 [Dendrobium catenatum]PKU65686.1 hypothetical protein MA16_Dca009723 [Dendrobium catenatum]
MEAIKSLQSCWRRRTYQRLERLPAPRKEIDVVTLGDEGGKKWRRCSKAVVLARPVIRLSKLTVIKTPGRVMARVRDAYMNVMLMLAGDGGVAAKKDGVGGAVWDRRIPRARQGSLKGGNFEKKVLIHLYNSVIDAR